MWKYNLCLSGTPISIQQTQQGYHIYVFVLKNESNISCHSDISYFIASLSNLIFFDIFSKMGDQEACAGVYWIQGAQYVKFSPEITQFSAVSQYINLGFYIFNNKKHNIEIEQFQFNFVESFKIAGNIFSCSLPQLQPSEQIQQIGYNL